MSNWWEAAPEVRQSTSAPANWWDAAPVAAGALDRRTGAPPSVRATVGNLTKPEDRLAAIRRVFPDAQPYGNGNFIYTDPRTGRPTLYNEENPRLLGVPLPTFGDIASIGPELAEAAGGTIGAVAGAPLGVGGAAAGAGLGAAGAREAYNLAVQTATGARDTRTLGQRSSDAAVTAAVNAAGQRAGDAIGDAARNFISSRQAPVRAADMVGANVRATPGAATGNRPVQMLEQGLMNSPGGAGPMGDAAASMIEDIAKETARVARRYGPTLNPDAAGRTVRGGLEASQKRMADRISSLYEEGYRLVGADRPVPLLNTSQYAADLAARVNAAPNSLSGDLNAAVMRATRLLSDADEASGTIRFDTLRDIRTTLREAIKKDQTQNTQAMQRLYDAITRDLNEAAMSAGPDAVRAMRKANVLTRVNAEELAPFVDRLLRTQSDDALWQTVQRMSREDVSSLARLRGTLSRDEWSAVAATLLDRMGLPTASASGAVEVGQQAADAGFSVNTFLTNWAKIADNPRATSLLFGSTEHRALVPELNRLVRVVGYAKEGERLANTSGTTRTTAIVGTLGAAGTAAMSGAPMTAVSILAGSVGAPYAAARLITHPPFVRWLVTASQPQMQNPANLRAMAGRLGAIAASNPDLKDAIESYRAGLLGAINGQPMPGIQGRAPAPPTTGAPQPPRLAPMGLPGE